jgi:alanyl-tRNA synthetase
MILDRTPFYGQAGGQVGDTGWLRRDGLQVHVRDTIKFGQDFVVHQGVVESGTISPGDEIEAVVDEGRRRAIALNHTATHLLHAALREVLGDHVKQAGSLVAPDRLRFDFSHFTQVGQEKLKEVESIVNNHIRENLPVSVEEMTRDDAMKTGAMAIFEERYGETVRLVKVGEGTSMELCGGTHTDRTGDIGLFKIISEGAVGANLRRVEALTGKTAFEYVQEQDDEIREAAHLLKTAPDQIKTRLLRLLDENRQRERELESFKAKLLSLQSGDLLQGAKEINGVAILAREVEVTNPRDLREYADRVKDKLQSGVAVLGAKNADKVMLLCIVTKDLTDRFKAGEIIRQLSEIVGGKGGGRPDMAQGGGNRPENLEKALQSVYDMIA